MNLGSLISALNQVTKNIERWCTCRNLTESFLIIINLLLVLKSSFNIAAIFEDSKSLISDYYGALLLSDSFKACVLLLNLVTFLGSILYLLALLFTLTLQGKTKLLRYSSHVQIFSAALVLFFMIRLWFWPFRLRLDQSDKWIVGMQEYDYTLSRCASRQSSQSALSSCNTSQTYTQMVDRVQDTLGCCGLWGPKEWNYKTRMGLIAPSCCPNPISFYLTPFVQHLTSQSVDSQQVEEKNLWRREVFYCQSVPEERLTGCQRLLDDHETRFVFSLRLTLLFMLGLQFVNLLSAQTVISINRRQINLADEVASLSSTLGPDTSFQAPNQSSELIKQTLFMHKPRDNRLPPGGSRISEPRERNVGESVITIS